MEKEREERSKIEIYLKVATIAMLTAVTLLACSAVVDVVLMIMNRI